MLDERLHVFHVHQVPLIRLVVSYLILVPLDLRFLGVLGLVFRPVLVLLPHLGPILHVPVLLSSLKGFIGDEITLVVELPLLHLLCL